MDAAAFPFWRLAEPLVLASASQIRRDMLLAAGIPLQVRTSSIDERLVERTARASAPEDETDFPVALSRYLAGAKALNVSLACPGRLVLGADQTLSSQERVFHKPDNRAGAIAQITDLSGRTHQLNAAMALARDGEIIASAVMSARLTMRALSRAFIVRYVDATLPGILSSVGGYQLEGAGIQLFERIEGDHFTILGLPLQEVLRALRKLDAIWH